ncbi:MAG: helix-turn-helix transcriptional regulator [Planctomycetes bacterium]|nr:helix-turn-helix transcriptional regulator [Planctomycetota bacterium]
MNQQLATKTFDEEIRERLRQLVKTRSQSDLARKTNTLVSTVNRYLKSTKIPGEFCTAVINGLGVNPAWLMTGEGTPFLADVSAGTSEMASNLLELVEAMNQVAKMKLGALTGQHHLKVLRELNDALERYESLRGVLNKRTRSVFREMLDSLRKALQDMDMQRATEVRKAALQVSRLCDDPNLNVEFDSLQEFYEHIFGDQVRALELSRKVFVKSLAASDVTMDKDHAALAINLIVSLHRADRCREARRICRATLALYEDVGADWGRYKQLMALHAVLNIELGFMREGLRDLHDTYPVLPDQLKRSFSGKLVESMLLSGLTPLEYAPAIGDESSAKAVALVRFAGLMDDPEHVRAFLKRYAGNDRTGLPADSIWEAYGRGLANDGKDAVAGFEKAVEAERNRIAVRPAQDFAYTACAAQLARISGDDKKARKLHEEAEVLLNSLDKQVTPQVMALALHHRNAQELYPENSKAKQTKSARAGAHKFFKHHYDQGYGAFAKFL